MPNVLSRFARRGDRFDVRLQPWARALLREVCEESRTLLEREDPSSDPAMARLFPPAYPDDPLQNLDFETALGDAPRSGKLRAIETVERTLDAAHLSEDELLSWIAVVNDARLVIGTRLDVTEESTEEDFADDEERAAAFEVFRYLAGLVYDMVAALDPELEEPTSEPSSDD
jgi:hypothetical protein